MLKNRKSIRLRDYDYFKEGVYFITICAHDKTNLFWNEVNMQNKKGENMVSPVRLNQIGLMVAKWWQKIFEKYDDEIKMDEYVIMPNHIHGIIHIVVRAIPCNRPNKKDNHAHNKSRIPNTYEGIGKYISWFKRMSTNEYIRHVKNDGWAVFDKQLWQRNYYEHIVRDEKDLLRIRGYIQNNPVKWEEDKYYTQGENMVSKGENMVSPVREFDK